MVLTLDLSNGWKVMGNELQTVSYYVKQTESTFATVASVAKAYWTKLTELDYRITPQLLSQDGRVVHLWANQLGGIIPKLYDKIVDSGSLTWRVVRVERMDLDANGVQRYRCTCSKQGG